MTGGKGEGWRKEGKKGDYMQDGKKIRKTMAKIRKDEEPNHSHIRTKAKMDGGEKAEMERGRGRSRVLRGDAESSLELANNSTIV